MATPWIDYANQGATRNLPLDNRLAQSLSFLQDMGIRASVFSGGQPAKGSGLPRVGSTRHDHGNAADVFFYQGDRKLDWANPQDLPIFEEIVRRGRDAGLTGFGAGPGYMQPGSMHIGFGSPGVWGAGGRSANAPEWLSAAFGSPAPNAQMASASPAAPQSGPTVLESIGVSGNFGPQAAQASSGAPMAPLPSAAAPQGAKPSSTDMMALLGSMAPQQPQFAPAQIQGPSPDQANALSQFVQSLRQRSMAG